MTTKKQTGKRERDSRLAAGGVTAAVVSIVASLTSLPSAGAADLIAPSTNHQFFSSVEANMQGPFGLERLEVKASWSDDDVREGQWPDKIEAFQSEELWMEWIDPSGVPAVAGEPARSELTKFGSEWKGNFLEITELEMEKNGDAGEKKVVSYLNGLLEFKFDWKESEQRKWEVRKITDYAVVTGNIPKKDVAEPSLTLGFITLASFMLGSRKKKEAKKT
jgi:hypothetical protein